jgi:MinD-like ATPase involved in chromosome partitioning or flagellar assembly
MSPFSFTQRGPRASTRRRRAGSVRWRSVPGLSFAQTPGPLLQVVGLCGGAGASTLACLTAATAAAQSKGRVLVCDTGGPTAGLALYTGVSAPRTLADAAQRLAAGEPLTGGLYAATDGGLRVIAGDPQFTITGDTIGLRRVLADARATHALTVLDGGTLAEKIALAQATHLAWVLPATAGAIARATRTLARVKALSCRELIVARAEASTPKPPVAALRDLAAERRAPLVLMPHVGDLAHTPVARAAEEADLTLQAIGWWLRR